MGELLIILSDNCREHADRIAQDTQIKDIFAK